MKATKTVIPTAVALTLACILSAGSTPALASPETQKEGPTAKAAPQPPRATSRPPPKYLGPPVKSGAAAARNPPPTYLGPPIREDPGTNRNPPPTFMGPPIKAGAGTTAKAPVPPKKK